MRHSIGKLRIAFVLLFVSALAPEVAPGQGVVIGNNAVSCSETALTTHDAVTVCPGAPLVPGTSLTITVDERANNLQQIPVAVRQGSLTLCEATLIAGQCPGTNAQISDIVGFGRMLNDPSGKYFVAMVSNLEDGETGAEPADRGIPLREIILFTELVVKEPVDEHGLEQLTYSAQSVNGTITYVITSDSPLDGNVVPEPATLALVAPGVLGMLGIFVRRGRGTGGDGKGREGPLG